MGNFFLTMKFRVLLAGGLLLLMLAFLAPKAAGAGMDDCWVCKKPIASTIYTWTDEVAGVKRHLCALCIDLPNACYLCSLPVKLDFTDLHDGRFLCERDAKNVLLDEERIKSLCQEVETSLNQRFARFLTFPSNVNYHVVDRLSLVDLFKIPGKDYTCPNVLGYTSPETNDQKQAEFSISILSGQTPAATEATCAHELTHAWMMSNLSRARQKELNRDSIEGFCELVSYILMREKNQTVEMAAILTNGYTRGQIRLMLDAEQRFGFSDVMDWMRSGETNRLRADEIWRIRDLKTVRKTNMPPAKVAAYAPPPEPALADRLMLKSISFGGKAPIALINQCTLGIGEIGKVKLTGTNLVIRCKEIRTNSVVVEVVGSGKTQELRFEEKAEKGVIWIEWGP